MADRTDIELMQHGVLTKAGMLKLLEPGALDRDRIVGRRVRWAFRTTRSDVADTKRASEELKRRHLELGAYEVLVHRGPWLEDETG